MNCEDSYALPVRPLLVDATRMADGKRLYIKRVRTGDAESSIACMLRAGALCGDPRNHSVPILEVFEDANYAGYSFMVMPFQREMDRPPFASVGEIVDFVDQMLEGLVFMHEQGVAHRDCAPKNILMDGDAMFPLGFHPVLDLFLPDAQTPTVYSIVPRAIAGVRYYFVDFGLSSYIPSGQPGLVVGMDDRDQDVPELSETVPYDPFKVDIFSIGSVFRQQFQEIFSNAEFLVPIIHAPAWKEIRRGVPALHRAWRTKARDESLVLLVILDVFSVFKLLLQFVNWLVGKR
ncbi:hypothetical protein BV25DRAFT_1832438 [Artomyces pyxidatus]|uniref:Uncharacterized protein n=1 Tax=Artomyces pyxidatus TaxID=48021 RepID=A0ACB8SK22_9AGAM|nr:hypothetical protein BV25DRAFT_1832438 [Artomyces pyxidatus]